MSVPAGVQAASADRIQVPLEVEKLPMVSLADGSAEEWQGDLLVLGIFEDAIKVSDDVVSIADDGLQRLDEQLGGTVSDIMVLHDFKGKAGSGGTLRAGGRVKFVQLVGLGAAHKAQPVVEWGTSVYQGLGVQIAGSAKTHKVKSVAVQLVGAPPMDSSVAGEAAGKLALGVMLGGYESTRFKAKPNVSKLESVAVLGLAGAEEAGVQAIAKAVALARAVYVGRYLVESPPNVATPAYLAHVAQTIAASTPHVMSCEVLEADQCRELGMGCYLAVAECSDLPPKFIHITYRPEGEVKKVVAIVGKGVTFDSGGYNIKTGGGSMIELMKFDMGGAAATIGAAKALSLLQPPGVEVHFIVPACENMVDGKGLRPGDVLKAANGKTVEVINTDAEGRLTLVDGMWFATQKCGATTMLDVATLTGSMIVSLGVAVAGYFTPSEQMAAALMEASKSGGEKLWRMPLEDSYMADLKSNIADIKNLGGRWAGAITAALFLRDFVDTDKIEWAHLDIAGPVWNEKLGGGTGYGVITLANWCCAQGR